VFYNVEINVNYEKGIDWFAPNVQRILERTQLTHSFEKPMLSLAEYTVYSTLVQQRTEHIICPNQRVKEKTKIIFIMGSTQNI
jgi:hypothetical protein